MIDQIKIGNFLKELRREKELTQEQLAEKCEIMKTEEKETLHEVADYAEAEKKIVVKRRCIVTFVGTLFFSLSIMIGCIVFPKLPEEHFMRSDGLWLGMAIIGLTCLWGTVIRENRKNAKRDK